MQPQLFQVVQQASDGREMCKVGWPVPKAEAEQWVSDAYRADWERTGHVTPLINYVAVAVA